MGYFDREDVALPGFAKYFNESSKEERGHAELLMKYQGQRGGRIVLQGIKKPERDEWGSGLEAMQAALALEKSVNQSLLDLHGVADSITQLKRVGTGVGEYLFDKHTLA